MFESLSGESKPHFQGLSYILGHPTSESTKTKIRNLAEDNNVSADQAWILFVNTVVEELQNEDSQASLSSILTLLMDRPVKAPKLYLVPYEMQTDGVTREHPMITFQVRNVIDEENRRMIEIDKNIADQISQILQMTFECDFVETVFVQ